MIQPTKRGRPAGQLNEPGHSAGRPAVVRSPHYQLRYDSWRAWWAIRPGGQPTAAALAQRMEEPPSTVRAAANGTRPPSETLLANLESLSAASGFEPATSDHQFL